MKMLDLDNGKSALVDDEDYERLAPHEWRTYRTPSDRRHEIWVALRWRKEGDEPMTTLMHREVLGLSPLDGVCVVHINGNRLDNRKANLLAADQSAVQRSRRFGVGTSGHKGVSWCARQRRWRAVLRIGDRKRHLGYFKDEILAAFAYDKVLRESGIVPQVLNFPDICDYGFLPLREPSSQYRGVSWHKGARKWMAYIKVNGRQVYLGLFDSEDDAAEARAVAATKASGPGVETSRRRSWRTAAANLLTRWKGMIRQVAGWARPTAKGPEASTRTKVRAAWYSRKPAGGVWCRQGICHGSP